MFDIHSHIIYHIDDGSRTLEESLALIRQDVEQGARAIIATPHYYVQYPTDPARIRAKLAAIEESLGIGEQPAASLAQTGDAPSSTSASQAAAQPTSGSSQTDAQPTPNTSQTTTQPTPGASEANTSALATRCSGSTV